METPAPRFTPGTLLADRYRVVALLGKGGMGEVYRCDDLKLEQSVALKFLPPEMAASEEYRARFLEEVRIARRVSHPGVCRVHDVGEVEGQLFLSMEYVDGEDLSSLLRRVGRLPEERAVALSHQLCAGLAAAHEQMVLHRDLKPANVLVDGEGNARLVDFGLAAVAASIEGAAARVGTPAYMAPEQLAGEQATRQSDLWSLGLVMFELFTGRPAFEAKTLEELQRLHAESKPSASAVLPDLDPAVERALQRCFERDPDRRPRSAQEVSAALPGGDPLAAALAAGETPSPELIAAAGERGALPRWAAITCLAFVVAGLVVIALTDRIMKLPDVVGPELPVAVLQHRAGQALEALGFEPGVDQAGGLISSVPGELTDLEHEDRWRRFRDPYAECLQLWFRRSPEVLVPTGAAGKVGWDDPPLAGGARLRLGHDGRLLLLEARPAAGGDDQATCDWTGAFELAQLDPDDFIPEEHNYTPLQPFTERRAWVERDASSPEGALIVRGAAFGSRPVAFHVFRDWNVPVVEMPERQAGARAVRGWALVLVIVLTLGVGVWLGARNLLQRKGDRRTASRVALTIFVLAGLDWALTADHLLQAGVVSELRLLISSAPDWLWVAGLAWFLYMAFEPTVRSVWPQKLVSWTRVLAGRWSDPSVGRDLLLGNVAGLFMLLITRAHWFTVLEMNSPAALPGGIDSDLWLGPSEVLGWLLREVSVAGLLALMGTYLFVLFRLVGRKPWLAVAAMVLLSLAFMPHSIISEHALIDTGFRLARIAVLILMLLRVGTLALVPAFFCVDAIPQISLSFALGEGWGNAPATAVVVLVLTVSSAAAFMATRPVQT